MSQTTRELLADLKTTFEAEFKTRHEAVEREAKAAGEASAEAKAALDRVQARLDEIEQTIEARAQAARYDTRDGHQEGRAEVKAFIDANRSDKAFAAYEAKAMTVSDDTTGGFLAPPEFVREIIKGEIEFSPMRGIIRMRETSAGSIKLPKRVGRLAARWVGETETRTETTGTSIGVEEIPTHEVMAMVDVSLWDLEDPYLDLEAYLRDEMAEAFAEAEGAAFVIGNGVKKPEGLLVHPDIEQVPTGSADGVTADGLIDIAYSLKTAYAKNAQWIMQRATIRDIRKLKDTNDQYLWQPGLAGSTPATILDRPYTEVPDMPAIQASALPIAFGDFKRAYVGVDRITMQWQRDPFTQNVDGMVRFIARKRTGGQVVLPEAVKVQVVSAA